MNEICVLNYKPHEVNKLILISVLSGSSEKSSKEGERVKKELSALGKDWREILKLRVDLSLFGKVLFDELSEFFRNLFAETTILELRGVQCGSVLSLVPTPLQPSEVREEVTVGTYLKNPVISSFDNFHGQVSSWEALHDCFILGHSGR